MAEEELAKVELRDAFYRDSIGKVILLIIAICIALILLAAMSAYLYTQRPPPVAFPVFEEYRVQPPVPLDQNYLRDPDLLQWVANVFINSFNFDYINYNDQVAAAQQYFTADGWKIFLNQLNIYANYNTVQANKLFVTGSPAGAPYKLKYGLLSGRYAWWVQMPLQINYQGLKPPPNKLITLQILVVRVSTLNNLNGVAIDNIIVVQPGTGPGT